MSAIALSPMVQLHLAICPNCAERASNLPDDAISLINQYVKANIQQQVTRNYHNEPREVWTDDRKENLEQSYSSVNTGLAAVRSMIQKWMLPREVLQRCMSIVNCVAPYRK